ncbi:hypothetical protein C8R47DRAFT_660817 [Mycena vitilis]|nr:hypothetical protein C8R47DRAFT_660817 [Mycena vitilis]
MPGRMMTMRKGHFVMCGPTHQYDRITGLWTECSELDVFYGSTQELFLQSKKKNHISYMGTYECQDLRYISPTGVARPAVTKRVIEVLALGAPRPPNYETIIRQCYHDGDIKVHAMGLRFIGFNRILYKSLRKKYAAGPEPLPVIQKRKAADEVAVAHDHSAHKRQKTEQSSA